LINETNQASRTMRVSLYASLVRFCYWTLDIYQRSWLLWLPWIS